ncbi:MAG: hypothetical protein COB67_12875 [SAR324 cluster bacterium]|uniref:Tetratricopeptide repeat protein n=1 Tax=SAR324 cluster bacterium TaxID=2024889 RepID=A0A2A4SQG5_9DELT|nr:MAG: hypothetical protein COB67_12875 [SAR324 cluster bacterium]
MSANSLENSLKFPIQLYEQKDYYRSISELLRLEFQFPQNSARQQLHLYLLKNYDAIDNFRKVEKTIAEIYSHSPSNPFTPEKRIAAKILTFSLLRQGQEKKAKELWEQLVLRQEDVDFPLASRIPGQVDPEQARSYSAILPGAGLLLSKEYGKASASFLLNGVFLLGIFQSLQNKQLGLAGLLFFFEWGWYSGGQEAAAEAANNYNQQLIETTQKQWTLTNRGR